MARIYHKLHDFQDEYGDQVPEFVVLHKGNFSSEYIYWMMREWFIENGWVSAKEEDFNETYYEHKEMPDGDEVYVRWNFTKESKAVNWPGDVNWDYHMDVLIHIMFMQNVEVMVDGRKLKMQNGEVEVKVKSRTVFVGKWEGWMKPFKHAVFRVAHFQKFDDVKTDLIMETQRFTNALKTYFRLKPEEAGEYQHFFLSTEEGR